MKCAPTRAAVLAAVLAAAIAVADAAQAEPDPSASPPAGLVFGRALDIAGQPLRLTRPMTAGPGRAVITARYAGPSALPRGMPLRAWGISSRYGTRLHPLTGTLRFHAGIDLPAPIGTSVHATAPGMIAYAGWMGGYGLCVIVDHGGGYTTLFGHLSSASTGSGVLVQAGQVLGRVGSTGQSTGPHLHYEVRRDAMPVDPRSYLGG